MSQRKPEPPKGRGRAIITRPGEKRPEPAQGAIPEMVGETIRIGVRVDGPTVDLINAHLDRLAAASGGMVVTVSDAIRSLLHRGAAAFDADDK